MCAFNTSKNYTFTINLLCDKSIEYGYRIDVLDTSDECNPIVGLSSSDSCSIFEANAAIRYVNDNVWIISILLITFGVFATFHGRKFFKTVVALLGMTITFWAIMLSFSPFDWLDNLTGTGVVAVVVVTISIALFFAILVGYILSTMIRVAICFLGASIGLLAGVAIFKLAIPEESVLMLLVVVISSSVFLAVLSLWFAEGIMIFGTSLVGSYMVVRGFSILIGNFPDEN